VEPFVVVPAGHRLAELDRIPRRELLEETVFTWPRDLNPTLVDHLRTAFFGETQHAHLVEIADGTEALVRVAAGDGITMTNHMVAEGLDIRSVEIRRIEAPAPEFEYGLVWLESNETPFVHDFVELAREITFDAIATP
jgi:DNA-binding transcriptional LysR family regulator